jgi:secernin
MGGDMVVALGGATLDGLTLFGHNCRCGRPGLTLHRGAGRSHAPEERIELGGGVVPQARETYTTIGAQPRGQWGYHHGVNDRGVAAGCTRMRTRLTSERPGPRGPDLVRLALERARTARQAVDHVTDLIRRHGQGAGPTEQRGDSAFLFADAGEAFVLETAGRYWAEQEVREVRAVSDVATVRQDWDGIASGFAALAIENGWWSADGSKVDFAGVAAPDKTEIAAPLRRWGRATLLLAEQSGKIDLAFVRRLLSDHYEGCADEVDPLRATPSPTALCSHAHSEDAAATGASLVVQLARSGVARLLWYCPGPPCIGAYLPLLLAGDLTEAYGPAVNTIHDSLGALLQSVGRNRSDWNQVRDSFGRLHARFDEEVEEFVAETSPGPDAGSKEANRRATLFMRHALERFEETVQGLLQKRPRRTAAIETPASIYL